MPGTPVELHRNGDWNNGWVVSDASDLHAVRVAKLGSPNVTVGSLRWELDVRLCQSSPFKADYEPEPWELDEGPHPDDSEPLDPLELEANDPDKHLDVLNDRLNTDLFDF